MLFEKNGRSVKFCLVGLDAEELKEIAELITSNGGEVCTVRKPPVLTFGNDKSVCRAGEPIFHINFIRECVRHQRLLHPVDFITTLCLPPLARKNQGSFFADDDVGRIHVEHNYFKLCVKRERDSRKLLTLTPQAPPIVLTLEGSSPLYSRYLRQMYSFLRENDRKNESEDRTSVEKHGDKTEAPRLWSPIVITRRWVRENPSKAIPQSDDDKLATQNRTMSPKIVESEATIDGTDETPWIQRLQERLDDFPLTERLHQTRKSKIEESEDSDDSLKILRTVKKRRILSSSSEESADSDATILLKDSGQTKRSNRDEESLDVETEEKMSEHSYDSEETVLWADFTREKRKSKDRRKPRCIYSDSTDTETFLPEKETEFRTSRESQAIARITSWTRESVTPVLLSIPSSDETEYEADTEHEDDRPSRVAKNKELPGTSLDMEKKEPQKLRNERDPSPVNLSEGSEDNRNEGAGSIGSDDDVVFINEDSDSDSSSAAKTRGSKARITVPVEAPKKKSRDRIERPGERNIQHHRLTRNYVLWEQKTMVKYLIDNNAISFSRGYEVWKRMIKDGLLTHRTYQSLHNHFRKSILPNIDRFGISGFDLEEFRELKR